MSAFAAIKWNTLSEHQLFTPTFAFKLFFVSTAIAIYHKLAKFEQHQMILTTQNLELFDKNMFIMLTISDISLAPF